MTIQNALNDLPLLYKNPVKVSPKEAVESNSIKTFLIEFQSLLGNLN